MLTPRQPYAHLAALDLAPGANRARAATLLRAWTAAAERMSRGEAPGDTAADTGVALGGGPASLTVTFGFGAGFFERVGLGPARGGAATRWEMAGFTRPPGIGSAAATHRNLMGQIDGTANPAPAADPDRRARILVEGPDAPGWLRGGSYVVVRRIRMLLDHWEGLPEHHREEAIGRRVADGAPLTGGTERTPVDLDAARPDGVPVIAANAHIRPAAPKGNSGATMLRRGWSHYDGRRPDGAPDAGMLFVAWQSDPRTGFVPVQHRLARGDALARYVVHEASALFVAARGPRRGEWVGQSLLEG
ncbi:Dyp-type peroxidase [Streptomyces sp. AB3(2024)]|uniref:Dyp-type peroxidase n=1 Tax=Streptomyces sp. AB3(2024) TaxID=3317321 RepID=UPI0035A389DA